MAPFMIALSLIAVVYIGFVALVQTDMKKLIAYSSISHMGFVTLGFFMFDAARMGSAIGVEGALVQMISHGFVSAAMFLCVGVMYDRMHSRQIADYGGVVHTMPKFAALFVFFAMANSGLPATSGFVGEFMVILGAVKFNFWVGFAAATTLILGAAYTLWMVKRVVFGAGRQRPCRRTAGHRRPRVPGTRPAGGLRPGHGPLPLPVHRSDARLGGQPAQACCDEQAVMNKHERHTCFACLGLRFAGRQRKTREKRC
jgi:NADH:ubiquinone oxidoreductase subunit 4 (subunit M)